MLHGVLSTKKGKMITAGMGLLVIILGVYAFTNYSKSHNFEEQAVMAENYLKAGSYEQAIKAYEKALKMTKSDQESLTIGLANAYIGINEYEKALEVLRSCYTKTSGLKLINKIEEVSSEKADYEYDRSISCAKIYFKNKEYDKAIAEYQKAKQIKGKKSAAYHGIAEAYIEMSEFDLARKEVLDGRTITQDVTLEQILVVIDARILKEQYNTLVKQAAEYISQENYKDGIAKYLEAIDLMPKETQAYSELSQTYITQKEYDKVITLLKKVTEHIKDENLRSLLDQATDNQKLEKQKQQLLSKLYNALDSRSISEVTKLMKSPLFKDNIAADAPLQYVPFRDNISNKICMIIYDSSNIFLGEVNSNKRVGKGIFFIVEPDSTKEGYYYYDGEWNNNVPDGEGKTVEEDQLTDKDGADYTNTLVTEGNFSNAEEDGRMMKYFYRDSKETGRLSYSAVKGVPILFTSDNNRISTNPKETSYVIGIIMRDGVEGEYFSVEPKTVWGVKTFLDID